MNRKLILVAFYMSVNLSGCSLPKVYFFETKPFIEAYKERINKNITISFGETIKDSFIIEAAGLKKMEVVEFKKSITSSLKNTFQGSYNSVLFSDSYSSEDLSIVIIKIEPNWRKKSSITSVTGYGGQVNSSTMYELSSVITYQVVVYLNGKRTKIIENEVLSEKSTFNVNETPEILKDGVKVMCQELYKEIINVK